MENIRLRNAPAGLHVEGFPDAVKVIRITGPKAKALADLGLHKHDLDFADECLTTLTDESAKPDVTREALWRSAIVHFIKCFTPSKSRSGLNPKNVYKGIRRALPAFEYFDSLRNKHMIHDENAYAQCIPGAVLNKSGIDPKIGKVVYMNIRGDTKNPDDISNLACLIRDALAWVTARSDELCGVVTTELESMPFDKLASMEGIKFTGPTVEDVHRVRPRP